jgi:hypothetical protein
LFYAKLNINPFLKHVFLTREPSNKLFEIDSQNQIWNNVVCKDDIKKTFSD